MIKVSAKKFIHEGTLCGIGLEWKTGSKVHRVGIHPFLFAPFEINRPSRFIRWYEYVTWFISRFVYIWEGFSSADYRILCFGYALRNKDMYGYFIGPDKP